MKIMFRMKDNSAPWAGIANANPIEIPFHIE
jgi:hypothetical protein